MAPIAVFDDLYRYNSWANAKILHLAEGLGDAQLDEPRELGFGTLRNTLFHILAAEEIWLERWQRTPPRPFPFEAGTTTLNEIAARLARVAEARGAFMAEHQGRFDTIIDYVDSKGTPYSNSLSELLLHVANHGIHHRAQALAYLKTFGRTTPVGIDHLFYRLASPYLPQSEDAAEWIRQAGIEVGTGTSPPLEWDADLVQRYLAYGDWATHKLLTTAEALDEAALDRDFGMGPGSIRSTLLHLYDAERTWLNVYQSGSGQFVRLPASTSLAALHELWKLLRAERSRMLNEIDATAATREVSISFGGPMMVFPLGEVLVHLAGHGTHHRAQLSNMLRRSGQAPPALDYVVWIRETAT